MGTEEELERPALFVPNYQIEIPVTYQSPFDSTKKILLIASSTMAILSCLCKWIDRQNNVDDNEGEGALEAGQRRNGQGQGQDEARPETSAQSTNDADKMFDLRQPKERRLIGAKLILGFKSSDSPTV